LTNKVKVQVKVEVETGRKRTKPVRTTFKGIQQTIRAISERDPYAARTYHALPGTARQTVLKRLDANGLRLLTRLIKETKKESFEAANKRFLTIAAGKIKTPAYLLDETLIEENMRIMRYVKERTGCKVLHALKAYASFATFPMMSRYLDGTCASGLHEARLGYAEFKKEVHTFAAAYKAQEIRRVLKYSDSIIFNSFYQLEKFGGLARKSGVEIGLRVNPGHAEVTAELYNPCATCSRLGIMHDVFSDRFPKHASMVDGLHFHAMCEQNSDVLERILDAFEKLYGPHIRGLKWVNFGGGHHVTRDDYDLERLIKLVNAFKKKYGVQVYLEPGEASVYHAGVLISSVLDIVRNQMDIAILDASAETHMPDVLLMPYRPHVMESGQPNEKSYTYRLAGPSCLAGDVMGDYSFDRPLKRGDRLVFTDMALYSIVKSTTFNGINLPDIAVIGAGGRRDVVKKFGYKDYRGRQS
jgi:carboxynorspermidine decarboxylase